MSAGTLAMETARCPRIGDRIRVRIPVGKTCEHVIHTSTERGQAGSVARVESWESHQYVVVFDCPIAWPSQVLRSDQAPIPLWAKHYDADELETIED